MQWLEKGVLGIEWSDGHKGVYPVRVLRLNCPCAACVDEWTGVRRLKPDDVPMFIMAQDIQPVGRYALQFTWSDGHDSGIYSYGLLRQLCQCDKTSEINIGGTAKLIEADYDILFPTFVTTFGDTLPVTDLTDRE